MLVLVQSIFPPFAKELFHYLSSSEGVSLECFIRAGRSSNAIRIKKWEISVHAVALSRVVVALTLILPSFTPLEQIR